MVNQLVDMEWKFGGETNLSVNLNLNTAIGISCVV